MHSLKALCRRVPQWCPEKLSLCLPALHRSPLLSGRGITRWAGGETASKSERLEMHLPNVCRIVEQANVSTGIFHIVRDSPPAPTSVPIQSASSKARKDGKNRFQQTEFARAETYRWGNDGGGDYLLVTSFSKSAAEYIISGRQCSQRVASRRNVRVAICVLGMGENALFFIFLHFVQRSNTPLSAQRINLLHIGSEKCWTLTKWMGKRHCVYLKVRYHQGIIKVALICFYCTTWLHCAFFDTELSSEAYRHWPIQISFTECIFCKISVKASKASTLYWSAMTISGHMLLLASLRGSECLQTTKGSIIKQKREPVQKHLDEQMFPDFTEPPGCHSWSCGLSSGSRRVLTSITEPRPLTAQPPRCPHHHCQGCTLRQTLCWRCQSASFCAKIKYSLAGKVVFNPSCINVW